MTTLSREERARAAVLATLAADSLSLGAHWVYDTDQIQSKLGRVDRLLPPMARYHQGKEAGDFTHYGDQALVLLSSVAATGSFDPDDFFIRWRELFADYKGYVDGATKKTLGRIEFDEGPATSGSNSDDLAGASRLGVLAHHLQNDPAGLESAAVAQAAMTHNNPLILDSARFFARTLAAVLEGSPPVAAMEKAAQGDFTSAPIAQWVKTGLASVETDSKSVISRFGQSCHVDSAFPGVVHLIARYENNLKEGLEESTMAGGDSAARSMLVGAILAAHLGLESIPSQWLEDMSAIQRVRELLDG